MKERRSVSNLNGASPESKVVQLIPLGYGLVGFA